MVSEGVVVVTGAGRGIGAEIVRQAAASGRTVVAACHPDTVDEAARAMTGTAGVDVVPLDVTDTASIHRFVVHVRDHHPGVQGLVNNAGILDESPFDALDDALWDRVLAVNLTGTFRMTQALREDLERSAHAAIVNMSSQLAYTGAPRVAAYAASKAGVLGLTRALAHDLAPRIRVNAVAPGPIESPMNEPYLGDEAWVRQKAGKSVQARFGTAAEVASAVMYLLSEGASLFTGQTLSANGGGYMS